MILTFIALLCLGLFQGPWDQVQAGVLPKPSIWADPGPIVSKGSPVTIWCQGSLQANGYILYRDRGSQPVDRKISKDSSNKTGFLIQSMSSQYAGLYRCAYSTGGSLSERSEPLFLVVTGVYREPSLSAQPGPLVSLGDTLTLQCRSEPGFDRFALTKDEGSTHPQRLHGQHSPDFPLGPVSLTHEGRYRCYSGHNLSYVWSAPSTPLDILITDYTVGNLIRLGVSGLILVVLGVLLFEAWHSRRRPHHAARS
ncbi:leukocyte immunoglobulin-like receptor subfamily A member 5 isoform X1 [Desmodus rotundus]|uniref:leukocyte immunoglobulin-like receptor subfamily A member 5 isoform X1 n=1 Tax=Desmodus rotundus TaxID=9430 RepID=UPI0023815AF4|nr:leukocyte immunoglobulin-like receptor subfamily A member 5 isoform X1 [Desmodus rotundus]